MKLQGKHLLIMQRTVPLMSCEMPWAIRTERGHYCRHQHTRRTMLLSSTDKNASYRNPVHQPVSRILCRLSSPSPLGNHATDCTWHGRSIVFLHTPSCVQIFIARDSLVMTKFPLGDLNDGLFMAGISKAVTLTMQLGRRIRWGATVSDGK